MNLRPATSSALEALRGRWSLSLVGSLILLPTSALGSLAQELAFNRAVWISLLVVVVLSLASGAVLLLAHLTVMRNRSRQPVALPIVLVVYLLAGAIRPPISWLFALLSNPSATLDPTKCVGAAIAAVIGLAIVAIALDALDRQRSAIRALQQEVDQLAAVQASTEIVLAAERANLEMTVGGQLLPVLSEIEDLLKGPSYQDFSADELHTTAAGIRRKTETIVRPLAHAAASSPPPATPARPTAVHERKNLRLTVRDTLTLDPFHPAATATLMLVVIAPTAIRLQGIYWIPILIPSIVLTWLATEAARSLLSATRRNRLPTSALAALVLGSFMGIAIAAMGLALLITAAIPSALPFDTWQIPTPVLTQFLFCLLLAMGSALVLRRKQAAASLRMATACLQFEIDQQARQISAIHQSASRRIHGDFQSRLLVISVRLDQLASSFARTNDAAATRAGVEELLADLALLRQAATELVPPPTNLKFDSTLSEITSLWHGLVDVSVSVDSTSYAATATNAALASALIGLVQEAITNSVKHGGASRVAIRIQQTEAGITLTCQDDGIGPPETVTAGLGLSSNTAGSIEWSLQGSRQTGATLQVTLPALDLAHWA